MAVPEELVNRVKARLETDVADDEIFAIVEEIAQEVDAQVGGETEITIDLLGDMHLSPNRKFLNFWRPIETVTSITEELDTVQTVLAADDYKIWHGGRTVERLATGTNPQSYWSQKVTAVYVPRTNDVGQMRRNGVIIDIAILELQYRGLTSERSGDYSASYPKLGEERAKLIASLSTTNWGAMA